jgi:hypothetical protein
LIANLETEQEKNKNLENENNEVKNSIETLLQSIKDKDGKII